MTDDKNITLHYLTWLERDLGKASESISMPDHVETVDHMLDHLISKGGRYEVFEKKHVIFADIGGEIVPHNKSLSGVRTISFFSPIVGG